MQVRPEQRDPGGDEHALRTRRRLRSEETSEEQQHAQDAGEMWPQLDKTIGRERGEARRRHEGEAPGAARSTKRRRQQDQHADDQTDVQHTQPLQRADPLDEGEEQLREPRARRRRTGCREEQRISREPGALAQVRLTEREVPPQIVREEGLADGPEDRGDQPRGRQAREGRDEAFDAPDPHGDPSAPAQRRRRPRHRSATRDQRSGDQRIRTPTPARYIHSSTETRKRANSRFAFGAGSLFAW